MTPHQIGIIVAIAAVLIAIDVICYCWFDTDGMFTWLIIRIILDIVIAIISGGGSGGFFSGSGGDSGGGGASDDW